MAESVQCMSCGFKGMVRDENKTETIRYAGESITITKLTGWFCPKCRDGVFDDESSQRYAEASDRLVMLARQRCREEVRRIRRKLGLTQKEAAAMFGGGINAFSRYERGEIEPGTATMQLLRLLDKHPELLNELRLAA